MSHRSSEACNLLFQTWTRPVQMRSLSLRMWLLTITHLPGWRMVFILLPKWVRDCMGLPVGLVVNCVNVCSKMKHGACSSYNCRKRSGSATCNAGSEYVHWWNDCFSCISVLCCGQMFIILEEHTASIFRVTGLLQVNVEVMWRKEMFWWHLLPKIHTEL